MTKVYGYDYELALQIAEKMSEGRPFYRACEDVGVRPRTAWDWYAQNSEFESMVKMAKLLSAEVIVAEALEEAENCNTEKDAIAKARLIVDTKKWYASKIAPKSYGDKVQIGGAEDLPPVKLQDQRLEQFTRSLLSLAASGATDDTPGDAEP